MRKTWAVTSGVLLLACFVLFGCTSLSSSGQPGQDEIRAVAAASRLPALPENGKAIVYVVRPSINCETHSFSVFTDNSQPESKMGSTKGRQYIYFDLTPGEHKILSKVDYWDTWAEATVLARAGGILFLQQEPDMGFITLTNTLVPLQEAEGKYHVKTLTMGTLTNPNSLRVATVPNPAGTEQREANDTFTGIITWGNWAKGVGFSNINVRIEVASDTGHKEMFYVRSDSKVADADGKYIDYREALRGKGKKVAIEYFTITDGTGGDPSRTDFAFEIGHKGVRVMRFLEWRSAK
jgi:hypothetical protein